METPVEVVLRLMDAVRNKAVERGMELVHEDAEFDWSESRAPYRGIYRGHADMEKFWDVWLEAWEAWEAEELARLR